MLPWPEEETLKKIKFFIIFLLLTNVIYYYFFFQSLIHSIIYLFIHLSIFVLQNALQKYLNE